MKRKRVIWEDSFKGRERRKIQKKHWGNSVPEALTLSRFMFYSSDTNGLVLQEY